MDGKITCSHILQKHLNSRNPVDSYRNKKIVRDESEALKNIENIRNEILKHGIQSFPKYASSYSECRSAANGGNLGLFGRGEMQKAFENAAYNLQIGEMSEPVSTDSGIHIILRTA